MIYEIDKKPYLKVDNHYVEVTVNKTGDVKPVKGYPRLYCSDVDEKNIKEYTIEEYSKKGVLRNDISVNKEIKQEH